MELTIRAANAKSLVEGLGRTLDDLKAAGRIDLSADTYLIATCNPGARHKTYRFRLIEVSHSGGRHLASLVHHQDRELLMACHADSDGTFAEREAGEQAAQTEQYAQERFKQRFLSA